MGFSRRFTVGLAAWVAALFVALLAFIAAIATEGLGAARIVAGILVIAAAWGLWNHVSRTNVAVARFLEALRFGDFGARFERQGDSGFQELGQAFDNALAALRADRDKAADELRFREALVDDMPIALLTVDEVGRVAPGNKAARSLFRHVHGARPEDYAVYGSTFAKRLGDDGAAREEVLLLSLDGRPQRALVRSAVLERLGARVRAVTVQPIQGTLDAVEMAAQTDIVRVLTHEILNSLTPVTSLASTAAALLEGQPPAATAELADARIAVSTLARRAEGLQHFVESYRAIARPPVIERTGFAALPWAEELARLFAADWPAVPLALSVTPPGLQLDADRNMLAQVLINLLRNAAEATSATRSDPSVALRIFTEREGRAGIEIEDNGPGVPDGLKGDIFLPFFTTRKTGTGVGLNLARQIVIAHGGTIDIADAPQGGALFRILL
ncbi:ATP-binding protein [Sphingomonas cannabina]|uniref:sensor histidine kinase n=1 Tax=Sphingomonas cannabina TaxID=2899123 RepID=UPI001F43F0D1|nr:ATP-binding protein [Sphingomonas cannabina]UIJ46051.1 ATP-binding protein [Sphingomonas cannabina]